MKRWIIGIILILVLLLPLIAAVPVAAAKHKSAKVNLASNSWSIDEAGLLSVTVNWDVTVSKLMLQLWDFTPPYNIAPVLYQYNLEQVNTATFTWQLIPTTEPHNFSVGVSEYHSAGTDAYSQIDITGQYFMPPMRNPDQF